MKEKQYFSYNAYLDESEGLKKATISRYGDKWKDFDINNSTIKDNHVSYLVPNLPIDIHLHGIGGFDFSSKGFFDITTVNNRAIDKGTFIVPCIFLAKNQLDELEEFADKYSFAKREGKASHIAGLALEGPLLSSYGGTPSQGNWLATKSDWLKIARCGEKGVKYVVLSPDIYTQGSCLYDKISSQTPSLEWIISLLFDAGIGISLGHFHKLNPEVSSDCIKSIIKIAQKHSNRMKIQDLIMVDHFLNDMPSNITYSWRTPERQAYRAREIQQLGLENWTLDNINHKMGPVPATLLKMAKDELLTICLNFDGDHVDLEICKRIVELVGSKNISAMTDHIDVNRMGNAKLIRAEKNRLWYQESGAVAAGMSSMDNQMSNLRNLGFSEKEIWEMCSFVPQRLLRLDDNNTKYFSYVPTSRSRSSLIMSNTLVNSR
ncbi:N-acetylglucosamine-6-phosphate deacetylase [Bacillus thuringiensis]|uniref:N-acetylglucosamine-6-phosphate deacetylase n=1 Tax=Bacillus thuringiensis TaxID=1428 RepID=UPI000BF61038|nr:N-acetylglucosamine-6-phosphate deacetylase [Bacillus thuringiensis]PFR37898.1 N-acetylglucosamine-6-phosphate deacetylase [Bacillus thuringiensis]PGL16715.1 N-acetylglucosamine-6-phosphate deacetylase [Bacillus thuringiensis]